jgi:hypothetical protein
VTTNPTKIELIVRLLAVTAVLDLRAEKAADDHKPYFADRAEQCRKWIMDLEEDQWADLEYIASGLQEFERLAQA